MPITTTTFYNKYVYICRHVTMSHRIYTLTHRRDEAGSGGEIVLHATRVRPLYLWCDSAICTRKRRKYPPHQEFCVTLGCHTPVTMSHSPPYSTPARSRYGFEPAFGRSIVGSIVGSTLALVACMPCPSHPHPHAQEIGVLVPPLTGRRTLASCPPAELSTC